MPKQIARVGLPARYLSDIKGTMLTELTDRYKEVLRTIVDAYLEHGEPIGSRTIAKNLTESLSAATIRNVMADLEDLGLLYAPHISAGRLPTQSGLRLFVDGLMEMRPIAQTDMQTINALAGSSDITEKDVYEKASGLLSSMSSCASILAAPTRDKSLRQIEFLQLSPGRVLIVLVSEDGMVENRVMEVPLDLPVSSLTMASNFLNARILGKTIGDIRREVSHDIESRQATLDAHTASLVQNGLAETVQGEAKDGVLVVRGQGNLLDAASLVDLEHIRQLFDALENRKTMLKLLEAVGEAGGMQIFIGSENKAFNHAGLSMVLSPYRDRKSQIIGAIGVIGPTRLNYGRIVPIVDYTSQILSRVIG